jgi:curved DNA-binding protein
MSAAKLSPANPTPDRARAILGLAPGASPHDLIGAFRVAAKLAHPDRPGGDAAKFREILAAYRLLQSAARLPATIHPTPVLMEPFVEIAPTIALHGGEAEAVMADGRRIRVRVPAGARHGERLTVGAARVAVRIAAHPDMQVRGSDVWVTAQVATAVLSTGGRASIETALGAHVIWISGKVADRRLVRLEGRGLPARNGHPEGSLFIRLVPEVGAPESVARAQLRKFASAWAA